MKNLTRKLIGPVIGLGLLAGATAGTTIADVGTASASTPPSIKFVSESYANGAFQEKVSGRGYVAGGRVWIGVAVDSWNASLDTYSWNYQWGTFVTATPRGIRYAGGDVSATISVNTGSFGGACRSALGLAASDQATGASTPAAPASQYGGVIPANQVNNTSQISSGFCVL